MSELDDRFVKHGFWINWDEGPVMGQILTVDGRTGNIVIALLTILASLATAQLWHLLTFVYHQIRVKGATPDGDGFFWQHQAVLRALPTPTVFIIDSCKLLWAWRTKAEKTLVRVSVPLSIAALFVVATITGGIFSTYVVQTSNIEVLVDSPHCARLNLTALWENQASSKSLSNADPIVRAYADDCYQNSTFLPRACRNIYTKANVSFSVNPAPCPWGAAMCQNETQPAIALDSGLLDIADLGFNVKPADGIKIRKLTTCNVLPLEGRTAVVNMSDYSSTMDRVPLEGEQAIAIRLGTIDGYAPEDRPEDTFVHSLISNNMTRTYTMSSMISYALPGVHDFHVDLLPEMNRTDADVALLAVYTNFVISAAPINDSLFSSHQRSDTVTYSGETDTYWSPDNIGGVIGCSEQYQFCIARKSNNDSCTSLSGLPPRLSREDFPDATEVQIAFLEILQRILVLKNILSSAAVKANDIVRTGLVTSLPDDQWKKEIISWEAFAWAGIQMMLADQAIGPVIRDPLGDTYNNPPVTKGEKQLCNSVKMRKSGGFSNINVFGLSFIVAFSVFITIFNITVLRCCLFVKRTQGKLAPRLDRWVQDGVFHWQRRAFEATTQTTWTRLEKEIPVTSEKERITETHITPMQSRSTLDSLTYPKKSASRDRVEIVSPLTSPV